METIIGKEAIGRIIAEAYEAPSGDNMRPWRFIVSGGRITARFVERDGADKIVYRIPPLFPGDAVALGALVENMQIVASRYGAFLEVEPVMDDGGLEASVRIAGPSSSPDPLYPQVAIRRTDRRAFSQEALETSVWEALDAAASLYGCRFVRLEDASSKDRFGSLAADFEEMMWNNPILRGYISHSFRFGKDVHEGVSLAHMGLGWKGPFFPPLLAAAKLFPPLFRIIGAFSASNTHRLVRSSSAVIAIVSDGRHDRRSTYVAGGRAFERAWLTLVAGGMAAQPLYGLVGTVLNSKFGIGGFSDKEQAWQRKAMDRIGELFPGTDPGTIVQFIRVGRPLHEPLPPVPHHIPDIEWME